MGYIHDLGAFVGKKFTDYHKEGDNLPSLISYGKIPEQLLETYNERYSNLIKQHKLIFDPILSSIKKSLSKYNRTRDPASSLGM